MAAWEWYCTRVGGAKTRAIIRAGRVACPAKDRNVIPRGGRVAATDRQFHIEANECVEATLSRCVTAVSLVLSLSPLADAAVAAAPPETIREATESSDIASGSGTKPVSPLAETPQLPDRQIELERGCRPAGSVPMMATAVSDSAAWKLQSIRTADARGADQPQEKSTTPDQAAKTGAGPRRRSRQKRQEPAKKRDRTREQTRYPHLAHAGQELHVYPAFRVRATAWQLYVPVRDAPPCSSIHTGIDLAAPEGTPFYAAASGWVTLADYDRPTADANTRIIIQHDGRNEGYATDYLHWIASYVHEGDYVHAGDPIGEVGNVGFSTGPHLHFSVTDLDTGEHIDPLAGSLANPGWRDMSAHAQCATETAGRNDRRPARIRRPRATIASVKETYPSLLQRTARAITRRGNTVERHGKASDSPRRRRQASEQEAIRDDAVSETNADEPANDGTTAPSLPRTGANPRAQQGRIAVRRRGQRGRRREPQSSG